MGTVEQHPKGVHGSGRWNDRLGAGFGRAAFGAIRQTAAIWPGACPPGCLHLSDIADEADGSSSYLSGAVFIPPLARKPPPAASAKPRGLFEDGFERSYFSASEIQPFQRPSLLEIHVSATALSF